VIIEMEPAPAVRVEKDRRIGYSTMDDPVIPTASKGAAMKSKSSYVIVTLVLAGALFALTAVLPAAPGASPQEKTAEDAQSAPAPKDARVPAGVSAAKPGVQPPIPAQRHRCCCCCCCCCPGDAGACKAFSKNPQSRPRLGSHGERAARIEKYKGKTGLAKWKARTSKRAKMSEKHCGPACLLKHADVLGLTEAQQDKLRDIEYSAQIKLIDGKAVLQKERLKLSRLMNEDDLNAAEVKRQLDAVFGAEADVKFESISAMIEARKVLTAGQRELLKEKYHKYGGR
jgi:Spy/CpxP family protein refolding chaperone